MELLVDLNERDGATIVAVLHDLALAAHFFPRVVADGPWPDRGRWATVGRPRPDHIRAVFGVDPALVRLPLGAA